MKANFTLDQLIEEVKRLANQNPDFVYQSIKNTDDSRRCSYTESADDPNKGCIFGQAILNLQPELKCVLNGSGASIKKLLFELGIIDADPFTQGYNNPDIEWCGVVQLQQDSERSWADAVKYADASK